MKNVIEINKPIVDALRTSARLPETPGTVGASLHVMYGDQFKPSGYLVHRFLALKQRDRYFVTESLSEALKILQVPDAELDKVAS